MVLRLLTLFILSLPIGWAKGQGRASGIAFDAALGFPSVTLTNPDGSKAGYDGLSLQGRLFAPIQESGKFRATIHGVLRYHDLENTSSGVDTEVANHIGTGLGLAFNFAKIQIGYEYLLMKARHYYIGDIGIKTEYDYTLSNVFVGLNVPFGNLGVGLSYGYSLGTISNAETGLSKDVDYNEQTIWLHVRYQTGASLGKLAKDLVK